MTAKFILSLDCEGKWGMADALTPTLHGLLSDASLRRAYDAVLGLLDEHSVAATFAFVGCFAMPRVDLDAALDDLAALDRQAPGYIGPAIADIVSGTQEGWTGDWAVKDTSNAATAHEIALHGVTHRPLSWPGVTTSVAKDEMEFLLRHYPAALDSATTFVHPRNQIAHVDVLARYGVVGFRTAPRHTTRLTSLVSEINLLSPPQHHAVATPVIAIPGGYFVNWLNGPRALVPVSVTRLRVRTMLRRASRTGRLVHFWSHPENIATSPRTIDVLRVVVEEVAAMRDAGMCEVMTQADYCRWISNGSRGATA